MRTRIAVLDNRVVVRPDPVETQTKSGLYIPDTAKDKPTMGTVVNVGAGALTPDGQLLPLRVKVGQRVLYPPYAGLPIDLDGESESLVLMREPDLLAIILDADDKEA